MKYDIDTVAGRIAMRKATEKKQAMRKRLNELRIELNELRETLLECRDDIDDYIAISEAVSDIKAQGRALLAQIRAA